MREFSLGIDTSNYKTSAALTDMDGNIICDERRLLTVKEGERGLRQQDALFQHINALPQVLRPVLETARHGRIVAVSASDAPRRRAGSYMPVFTAGVSAAEIIAAMLGVEVQFFSHQEGHIAAACRGTLIEYMSDFLAFHFSGGTTEGLAVTGASSEIVAGTRDISYGQVLDRIGVLMGFGFPCGETLDELASGYMLKNGIPKKNILPKIRTSDGFIDLSGLETAFAREFAKRYTEDDMLVAYLFMRITESMADMTRAAAEKTGLNDVIYAGGVSSSCTIRMLLPAMTYGISICFGEPSLASDNAVGTAMLGGRNIWK